MTRPYRKREKHKIQEFLVCLTICYCIFFPADKLNIKEILLFFTLISGSPYIVSAAKKRNNLLILLYGILYPVLTILLSVTIGDSGFADAISYGYVWVYLLLIPIIIRLNIDIKKPFIISTLIVAVMTNFIYLADVLRIIAIQRNPILIFFSRMNEMQWGKGELATFGYSIFFKSSPLAVFTFGYMLTRKKYLWVGILLFSFIASGTRANLYIGLFLLFAIPLVNSKAMSKRLIVVLIAIAVSLFFAPRLIERITQLNVLKYDRSEKIKFLAINSIFDHMNADPIRYIFGSGIGSYFYTLGRNSYVNIVEVSYFDYFRQVGIVGFSFFLYFLSKPLKWLYDNQRWMLLCMGGYLAIAFTNPLLVTSTSFVAYIMILTNAMGSKRMSLLRT